MIHNSYYLTYLGCNQTESSYSQNTQLRVQKVGKIMISFFTYFPIQEHWDTSVNESCFKRSNKQIFAMLIVMCTQHVPILQPLNV